MAAEGRTDGGGLRCRGAFNSEGPLRMVKTMDCHINEKKTLVVRRRRIQWGCMCGFVLLCLVSGCSGREQDSVAQRVVAKVNGEIISQAAFLDKRAEELTLARDRQGITVEDRETLNMEVLAAMIDERLILQRGQTLGLTVDNAVVESRIEEIRRDYSEEGFKALFDQGRIDYKVWRESLRQRLLIEKVVATDVKARVVVDVAEAEKYFLANRKAYATNEKLQVHQIVVQERKQAETVLKRLKAGEDFDKLAREVSIGPEGARGGALGLVERGVMPEAIDRVIFSLPVGKLSRVVESPYGFHLFKVLRREKRGGRTFTEAMPRVIAELQRQKEEEAYERWIDELRTKAVIEIQRPLPDFPVL